MFTLTVFPEGRMILSTESDLTGDEAQLVMAIFDDWRNDPDGVAFIAACRVEHAASVELELPVPA